MAVFKHGMELLSFYKPKIGVAPGKKTQPVKVLANKSDDQRFVYMVKENSRL